MLQEFRRASFRLGAILLALSTISCGTVSPAEPRVAPSAEIAEQSRPSPQAQTLRVALFPWIPDAAEDEFASLRSSLEKEFERRHPEIDLELRLKLYDDSYYSPAKVAAWLASGDYDLVEIDTVILGDLLEADVLAPWPTQNAGDFFPAAASAATVTEKGEEGQEDKVTWWGVPHLLCGFFLVTHSESIDEASTIDELIAAVEATGQPVYGNFDSSWDLPSLYLDSRVDHDFDPDDLDEAIRPPLDEATATSVDRFADLCQVGDKNPCVDGTFSNDFDGPVQRFVDGETAGYWGYSERLHLTSKLLIEQGKSPYDLFIGSIALGPQRTPTLFTDALVRSTGCADDAGCDHASRLFAEFINSDWAIQEVLLSGDAKAIGKPAPPRYLLPATRSAYSLEGIANDPYYQELFPFAMSGVALPNEGEMVERRRVIQWLLLQRIQDE
ncbi:MAG: hypothetical protein AAGD01_04815 [Acidobacteriota bacterium]